MDAVWRVIEENHPVGVLQLDLLAPLSLGYQEESPSVEQLFQCSWNRVSVLQVPASASFIIQGRSIYDCSMQFTDEWSSSNSLGWPGSRALPPWIQWNMNKNSFLTVRYCLGPRFHVKTVEKEGSLNNRRKEEKTLPQFNLLTLSTSASSEGDFADAFACYIIYPLHFSIN